MRVLITGLPLFSDRLCRELSAFDPDNRYYRLDTYYSRFDQLKALFMLPFVDVVYSINGTVQKSRVFDLAFKLNKKVVMNWVGTDVVKALNTQNPNQNYIKKAIHLCEVDWIKDELETIRIHAEILNFAVFETKFDAEVPNEPFTVLSYIPGNRSVFYGINELRELAVDFPDIRFLIAGATGDELGELPANIKPLGWVKNMDEVFNSSHVCLRFPEHDGLSNFILESLARGKQVLYKYNFPNCHYSPEVKDLKHNLTQIKKQFDDGDLKLNEAGIIYIQKNFNRETILDGLVSKLKQISDQ